MNWKRPIPWILLACEFAVFVCLFGMLTLAGISAGFYWWPMPTALAIGWLFAVGCIWMARSKGRTTRWVLWMASFVPAIYFSFFILKDSWEMGHPVTESWIIPEGYQGPIYVVHGVPNGVTATVAKDRLVFRLDAHGVAMVREPAEYRWKSASYEYVFADGSRKIIPEGTTGTIDDTSANRMDQTVRIYFDGSGRGGGSDDCSYEYEEAWVESPQFSLSRKSFSDDLISSLRRLYPGMCTKVWSK